MWGPRVLKKSINWDKTDEEFGDETTVGHKWCWCPATLSPLLYNAGFSKVEEKEAYIHHNPSRDFLLVAFK